MLYTGAQAYNEYKPHLFDDEAAFLGDE